MKYFNVTLIEKGKKRQELVKAEHRVSAISIAKNKFPKTIVIKAVETSAPLEETIAELFSGLKKSMKSTIPLNDKISTIRQIAVMTDAGIPINDTLAEVAENVDNKQLKAIYSQLNNDINAGSSLSDSMSQFTEEFGHVALAMTDLGERTGNLAESYTKLADILESIRDNKAKFKKAIGAH